MANFSVKQYIPLGFSIGKFVAAIGQLDTQSGTTKSAVLIEDGLRVKIQGTGFKYDAKGELIAGVITSATIEVKVGSKFVAAVAIADVSVNVAKALASPTTYDPFKGMGINYDATQFVGTANDPGANFGGTDFGDKLTGSKTADFLAGWGGNDTILGGGGNDLIDGGAGNDTLKGDAGDDMLSGGMGNDNINGGTGADYISFLDPVSKANLPGVKVDLTKQTATGQGTDTLVSIEHVIGSNFKDTIIGSAGANNLLGGAGNDIIDGRAGNDKIAGGAGVNTLTGGAGKDAFTFISASAGDRVTDYSVADDSIVLDRADFPKLAAGVVKSANFVSGTKALDGNDYFIYDRTKGNLYYDKDGSGAGKAQLLAVFEDKPKIVASEITILANMSDYWY